MISVLSGGEAVYLQSRYSTKANVPQRCPQGDSTCPDFPRIVPRLRSLTCESCMGAQRRLSAGRFMGSGSSRMSWVFASQRWRP